MRPGTTVDDLAKLKTRSARTAGSPRATPHQRHATASLLASEETAKNRACPSRCGWSLTPSPASPRGDGRGPIPSTDKALAKAGLTIDDIDAFEINEA